MIYAFNGFTIRHFRPFLWHKGGHRLLPLVLILLVFLLYLVCLSVNPIDLAVELHDRFYLGRFCHLFFWIVVNYCSEHVLLREPVHNRWSFFGLLFKLKLLGLEFLHFHLVFIHIVEVPLKYTEGLHYLQEFAGSHYLRELVIPLFHNDRRSLRLLPDPLSLLKGSLTV